MHTPPTESSLIRKYFFRSGMKAMTAPRRKLPRQKYIFSLLEAQRGIIPFFSLYQLQIVLLTIANRKKY